MSPNEVTLPHPFVATVKDKAVCRHCGMSEHATIHPRTNGEERKQQPFEYDVVEAPAHYCKHKVTTAQLVVDWELNFFLGNVLKYVERHQAKDGVQDLKKAAKYLSMAVELAEKGRLDESIRHG
jgi:hypothetical protein